MIRKAIALALVALLLSCGPKKSDDVMAGKDNTPVARVTQCTQGNPDGVRCDRKTCRKDTVSDCAIFRDKCKNAGHDYDGNNDEGTCIRKEEIG